MDASTLHGALTRAIQENENGQDAGYLSSCTRSALKPGSYSPPMTVSSVLDEAGDALLQPHLSRWVIYCNCVCHLVQLQSPCFEDTPCILSGIYSKVEHSSVRSITMAFKPMLLEILARGLSKLRMYMDVSSVVETNNKDELKIADNGEMNLLLPYERATVALCSGTCSQHVIYFFY